MSRFDSSVARALDFGESAIHPTAHKTRDMNARFRLAPTAGPLRGPEKYKMLERRRRRAQITARRTLDLIDVLERAGRNEAAALEEAK
jgi:hypothetical protein